MNEYDYDIFHIILLNYIKHFYQIPLFYYYHLKNIVVVKYDVYVNSYYYHN